MRDRAEVVVVVVALGVRNRRPIDSGRVDRKQRPVEVERRRGDIQQEEGRREGIAEPFGSDLRGRRRDGDPGPGCYTWSGRS